MIYKSVVHIDSTVLTPALTGTLRAHRMITGDTGDHMVDTHGSATICTREQAFTPAHPPAQNTFARVRRATHI